MSDHQIEPLEVIRAIESYVERELHDTAKYSNREPFDQPGVWSLHQTARDIYARGVDDGTRQEDERQRCQRNRDRETVKATPAADTPSGPWGPDEDTKARQACEWSDYRKDGIASDPLTAAHKAFLAGWSAAMGNTFEGGPLR
ncbi:hypothetical protein NONO_c17700 [Nocardia nova SH22a]|uniref:Uncharacterized protein n=1 Tax=Nocardia nova SH22a TaxID=1415166 RepID=W5TB29_9NOCA|nr:hypothetical protein [Nocardia nova]AHH16570.1 hypothetical protein NONO_c17700 [Nocardia nova SH22a]